MPGVSEPEPAYSSDNPAFSGEQTERDLRFPVLSQTPSQRPQREAPAVVKAQYDALMKKHDLLASGVAEDIAKARADRQQTVTIMVDGKAVEVPIEEAIARLEAAKQADQAAAKRQTSQPLPKLGGKPPKSDR